VQQFETPLSPERAQLLGKVYSVATSTSVEVKTSYLLIALKANDTSCFGDVVEWLGQVGRNKYVRPLLRALNKVDRQLALDAFQRHKDFYHPVCRGMVERDLGITA
jgi:leukotriene-A4 hydrolase